MIGLHFLKMWKWIMYEIRKNHQVKYHKKYWRKNMYMIFWFTYLHIKNWFSWKIILMGSTSMLQLLVSGFLTVILLLLYLSQKKIWTTVVFIITKQKVWVVTKKYWKKYGFSQKIILKWHSEAKIHNMCLII